MTYQEFLELYPHDPKSPLRFGGQATIYVSTNAKGEKVAIKRAQVLTGKLDDKYSVLQEFILGQSLAHPNLAKYYGAYRIKTSMGEFDFGIMEFVDEGNNLLDFLESFPDEIKIKKVLLGLLEGIDYLHSNNVIHRDLKPNNILIANLGSKQNPVPKIIDFGVSKKLNASETVASAIVGTFEYMAPEQINLMAGQKLQPNVDLWAFGVIVYRIFTGDMPFGSIENGDTRERIQNQVLDARLPSAARSIPEPYRTMVMRCLVRDPKQRVQKAQELINILQKEIYEQDTYTVDSGTPSVHRMKKMGKSLEKSTSSSDLPKPAQVPVNKEVPSKRSSFSLMMLIAVLLAIMGGGGWFGYKWYQKKQIDASIEKGVSYFLSSKYKRALDALEPLAQNPYMSGVGFYVLGELNYHGYYPIPKDSVAAEKYFDLASKNDCAEGLIHLGDMYFEGTIYKKDTTLARQKYQQCRKLLLADGSQRATRFAALGDLFLDQRAGTVDEEKAFDNYRRSAEAGFSYAMFRLGNCYENGTGVAQNESKAFEWYQKAEDLGDPLGIYYLGSAYERGIGVAKDPIQAMRLYKTGANLYNESNCMYSLGIIYYYGTADPPIHKNVDQGMEWLEKAADNGNAQAQFELAYLYQEGSSGAPRDFNKAVSLYQKSADQDYSPAQYFLAQLYLQGFGVKKDSDKAFALLQKAAAAGYVDAMNTLGVLYDTGEGTSVNDTEAVKWYRKAALNNHAQAQANLAYMFEMGQGVRSNQDSAIYYYNLAQKQGITAARERMAWIKIQRAR
jgi:TPR repeat protein